MGLWIAGTISVISILAIMVMMLTGTAHHTFFEDWDD